MPHKVAVFCKSFEEDFHRLQSLLASCERYCNSIPFILSVPKDQVIALRQLVSLGSEVEVICDEDYARPADAGPYGWFQQQVCKLSIHRTGLADAYMCVDSDAYFVNNFDHNDIFDGEKRRIIYSALFTKYTPDNDALRQYLLEETTPSLPPQAGSLEGFTERLVELRDWIRHSGDSSPVDRASWINRLFSVPPSTSLQPGQIFHSGLLRNMEEFFRGYGIGVGELIRLIPWEFNWYGCWVSAYAGQDVTRSISPIVHFASAADVQHARAVGITPQHLSARFRVVQMAARHFDALSY